MEEGRRRGDKEVRHLIWDSYVPVYVCERRGEECCTMRMCGYGSGCGVVSPAI